MPLIRRDEVAKIFDWGDDSAAGSEVCKVDGTGDGVFETSEDERAKRVHYKWLVDV